MSFSDRKLRSRITFRAIFGPTTLRFGAMLGTFTFIYKFILNSLPLLPMDTQLAIAQFFSSRDLKAAFYCESYAGSPIRKDTSQPQKLKSEDKIPDEQSMRGGSSLSLAGKFNYSRIHVARWHAFVAGASAGFSVLFQRGEQRTMIAQQMFVRYSTSWI